MDYQDFTIDLRSTAEGSFEATVVDAPLSDAPRAVFAHPLDQETFQALQPPSSRTETGTPPVEPREISPEAVGQQLFSAVFSGEVGPLFQRCWDRVCGRDDAGLRLRLRFLADDQEAEYLAALPWEWLWNPGSGDFLATDLGTPVVREYAARQPRRALAVDPPLRILVVDASPSTLKHLNLKLETERMIEALRPLVNTRQVELLGLKKATADELRDVLLNEEIHALHFMGHAGYHAASGYGAVYFVQDDGTENQLDGLMLASFLKEARSLRLVVLNACKTACFAGRTRAPLHHGVSSAVLAQTGMPALVANQRSISDDAAISLSASLYERLAAGDGIDEALTEARKRLRARTRHWATPVLFLAAQDGKLFGLPPVKTQHSIRLLRARSDEPVRLGVRTILGWGRDMEARNDKVLDLSQYFEENRFIKQREWWQEKVFPELRDFLLRSIDERRPLLLDFAAHSSLAFAAGWVLEPKSGLDVAVRQRTQGEGEFEWHPKDASEPEGILWLDRPDIEPDATGPDVAVSVAVAQANVPNQVRAFVEHEPLPVGRIVDATIAPEPGPRSVRGGAHALRLAQALLARVQPRSPHERGGRIHLFCAAPNALVFYLGQLASSLGRTVLYEYPFKAEDAYGRYQKSIELPPPGEALKLPDGW